MTEEERLAYWSPRMLTHEQGRREQRLYWANKTIPERLEEMWRLNERLRPMRAAKSHESQPYSNPRFVRRDRS